ncbi:PREDICTED: uncharacterized protein LOC106815076 isoform X2 [Priapulus caudatus]|uniref:Uncharacterized protein LOC106815076 isoform X2 n=1 Tax=Priapulus caudatus TaxID=37621 RepID=A0ABM1ES14_PRICU|nr:PREDICTED: uncharacterized protein LOC106815076 isoform X2 [Priapulus caudatus]
MEVFLKNVDNSSSSDPHALSVFNICHQLKLHGQELESNCKENLDKYFLRLRNAAKLDKLDYMSRLRLLEIIELRAMGWNPTDTVNNYYKRRSAEVEVEESEKETAVSSAVLSEVYAGQITTATTVVPGTLSSGPPPSPGTVRPSGKYAKPFKVPGKNYFKDEILIRGSDSGKANQGAKERTVQITGPSEESINHAKVLIEETIKRNVSPIRYERSGSMSSLCSGASEEGSAAKLLVKGSRNTSSNSLVSEVTQNKDAEVEVPRRVSVTVKDTTIKMTCGRPEVLKVAKQLLEQYFSADGEPKPQSSWKIGNKSIKGKSDSWRGAFQSSTSDCADEVSSEGTVEDKEVHDISAPTERHTPMMKTRVSHEEPHAGKAVGAGDAKHQDTEKRHNKCPPVTHTTNRTRSYTSPDLNDAVATTRPHSIHVMPPMAPPSVTQLQHPFNNYNKVQHLRSSPAQGRKNGYPMRPDSCPSLQQPTPGLDLAYGYSLDGGYPQVMLMRQPLFPDSSRQAVHMAEKANDLSHTFSARGRRAQFAKTLEQSRTTKPTAPVSVTPVSVTLASATPIRIAPVSSRAESAIQATGRVSMQTAAKGSKATAAKPVQDANTLQEGSAAVANNRVVYTRDFLLACSESPFCRVTPRALPRLSNDVPDIVKKTIDSFNPAAYRKQLAQRTQLATSIPSIAEDHRKSCLF